MIIGGPIWNDRIHNIDFVKAMHEQAGKEESKKFGTVGRIKGILGGIIDEECLAHKPLSFDLAQICSNLKTKNPTKNEVIAGIRSLNFKGVQTYYNPNLWKTDAPPEVIYDMIKSHKKEQCDKDKSDFFLNIHKTSPMLEILNRPIVHKPDFSIEQMKASQTAESKKVLRKYF